MANVSIKFNGKEYLLSCEDGQEEHLEELASNLNIKFEELRSSLGNIGENRLLLITSIKVMDEYYETKKKISQKKNDLEKITSEFRALKSLSKFTIPNLFGSFTLYAKIVAPDSL